MRNFLIGAAMYLIGAAVGGFVVYRHMKRLHNDFLDRRVSADNGPVEGYVDENGEPHIYEEENEYRELSGRYSQSEESEPEVEVISPEEFGELGEDESQTLSYICYPEGVITTDDDDEPLTDEEIKKFFGDISIEEHFGEYEEDSVYIRNHKLHVDCEILRSARDYSEVVR